MEQDYEYDIFISYRRRQPVMDWMRYHFYPMLNERLPDCLPYTPNVFIDWNIETGAEWSAELSRALKRSRCLVAIWSAEYFRSAWCLAEWQTMRERERILGLRSESNPAGLIYAVRFSDGKYFPQEARSIQYRDLGKWNSKYPSLSQTTHIIDFEREMQAVCNELSSIIERCPSWQDWPVVTPQVDEQLDFKLPRMGDLIISYRGRDD